jgi:hypothetical protein
MRLIKSNLQNNKACYRNRWAAFVHRFTLQINVKQANVLQTNQTFFKACFAVSKKCSVYFMIRMGSASFLVFKLLQNIYYLLAAMNWENILRGFSMFSLFSRTNLTTCWPDFPPNNLQIFYKERILYRIQTGKF